MKLIKMMASVGGVLVILVAISAKIMYDETQREITYKKMTVKKSACVTKKYKSQNVYDCRTEVMHEDGSSERITLAFSVLPDDVIYLKTATKYGMARGYSIYTRYK